MKVLLVDDEPMVLESGRVLLGHLGFDVEPVARSDAILPAIRQHRPDVVIQDVRMPGLDLPALVAAIRREPGIAATRVVLCSASMEVEDIARTVGADDWLEKPYSAGEIAEKIRTARQAS